MKLKERLGEMSVFHLPQISQDVWCPILLAHRESVLNHYGRFTVYNGILLKYGIES